MAELRISDTRSRARRGLVPRRAGAAIVATALAAACSGAPPLEGAAAAPPAAPSGSVGAGAVATPPPVSATVSAAASVRPSPALPEPSPERPSEGPEIAIQPVDAPWTLALDGIVEGPHVSVAVGVGRRIVYAHGGNARRVPASGQKLLTSIAALERFGPAHRFPTIAASRARPRDGFVRGDLWLIGGGDPELSAHRLGALADALVDAGLRRITGAVAGDTRAFSRRWWAPGWIEGLSRRYVTRPTALTFDGNTSASPELAASRTLAAALSARGVVIGREPRVGDAPETVRELARVRSAPLRDLLARQNHSSLNLHAEVLLRALGDDVGIATTAGGADVVEDVARAAGTTIRVRDGSGLSHGNAIDAIELTSLLLTAASEPWGPAFVESLPGPGEGTLRGRLTGVPVRAKTGTLFTVPCSTLAGYVRDANGHRIAFAVLSDGIPKGSSIAVEDAVVRLLAASAVG